MTVKTAVISAGDRLPARAGEGGASGRAPCDGGKSFWTRDLHPPTDGRDRKFGLRGTGVAETPDEQDEKLDETAGGGPMVRHAHNRYCTRCLRTRRFYEVGDGFVCECCRKLLLKVTPGENLKSA